MLVRSAAAVLGLLGAALTNCPSVAQSVNPAAVLAAKSHGKHGAGFADRTARISSIMGTDLSTAEPLRLPNKPIWTRPARREADASAAFR